jgi:ankyrin repeat protein
VNAHAENGMTSLHVATHENNLSVMIDLLEAGANADAKDEVGNSPLFFATMRCMLSAVFVLLDYGADPHQVSLSLLGVFVLFLEINKYKVLSRCV